MAMSGGKDDGEPMMEMNTTPLIDVMLVLLIMFIITIPVQTHAVKVDLPVGENNDPSDVYPVINKIFITKENVLLWNGTPVSEADLGTRLVATTNMNPIPQLQLEPEELARYDTVDRTLALILDSGVTALGFVGNERHGSFGKAEVSE